MIVCLASALLTVPLLAQSTSPATTQAISDAQLRRIIASMRQEILALRAENKSLKSSLDEANKKLDAYEKANARTAPPPAITPLGIEKQMSEAEAKKAAGKNPTQESLDSDGNGYYIWDKTEDDGSISNVRADFENHKVVRVTKSQAGKQ